MKTITKNDALAILEAAVKERGSGFTYRDKYPTGGCVYARELPGETPEACCIVGLGLNLAGLRLDDLLRLDGGFLAIAGFYASGAAGFDWQRAEDYAHWILLDQGVSELIPLSFEVTENAARVLWAAQLQQDNNRTWGEALSFARKVAALLPDEVVQDV